MSHRNARLTVHGRLLLIDRVVGQGWAVAHAAKAHGGLSTECAPLDVWFRCRGRVRPGRPTHSSPSVPSRSTKPTSSSSRVGAWSQLGAWNWRPKRTSHRCGVGSFLSPGQEVTDGCSYGCLASKCPAGE
jgi:hypothetical protein